MPGELTEQIERAELASFSSDLHATEDVMLVAAAKNGEATAFAMLVERHQRRIFSMALHMTRNREDAEDVVQQSFQSAFLHLQQFEGRSSFSTWLIRIAINEARMVLRKNRGSRQVSINDSTPDEELSGFEIPDSSQSPEASYSQQEWVGMLSLAMNDLTPGVRKAIELRELGERSSEETARIMGISVSAVKARVFHGRRKLRARLKHQLGLRWTSARHASQTIDNTRNISQDEVACNACA